MNGGNGQSTASGYKLDKMSLTYGVLYSANQIDYVGDYFPYGKILREFVNADRERYLTTQHERDAETGLDYRGARYYDADIARFLSLDPLAKDFASWSPYNYVMGNPVSLVDPDGKAPQTKFVDRTGKILVDIDDGSDDIYVIEFSNKKEFYNDILSSVNGDFDILKQDNNKKIGEKYGFNFSEYVDNTCPECAYQTKLDLLHSKYRAGYAHGYNEEIPSVLLIGDQKNGGSAYLYGHSHGLKDKKAGLMNTFDLELKNNTPFLDFDYNSESKELKLKIFGVNGDRERMQEWINKLFK